MTKKILPLIFLVAILLAACGAQATESPTVTPSATTAPATNTPKPTSTPVSEDTLTPTIETTAAPTATLPPPENAADCTNAGKFISDVTIPDNSDVNIGETFTKTWRVQNVGTCIWWEGYTVAHYSESSFSAEESFPLPRTNPGETADISIDLLAPSTEGFYRGNFVIKNPLGLAMEIEGDSRLWLLFNAVDPGTAVTSVPTIIPTAPPGGNAGGSGGGVTLNNANCSFLRQDSRIDGVFAAINTYRAASGLPPYNLNFELIDAAQSHSADMACNQLFYHDGTDGSTPETRAAAAGFTGKVTENVYGSYPPLSPEEAKEWWRKDKVDPRHNLNLISTEYTEVGIGYAFFDNFGYYVVVFGAP